MLDPDEFWGRIDKEHATTVPIAFLTSWKRIADNVGMEGIDIAENIFTQLCRFATETAEAQSRLSVVVFGAYWGTSGAERRALEVFGRWLPMTISSKSTSLPIDVSWFVVERASGESARDLFRRTQVSLDELVMRLPANERDIPHISWKGGAA